MGTMSEPLRQHPGEGELRRRTALVFGQRLDLLHKIEVVLEVRAGEAGQASPPVAGRKVIGTSDLAREKPPAQRAISDETNPKLTHRVEDGAFGLAAPKRVFRLQRGEGMHRMRAADRLARGFREAEIADLALADERRHGADRLHDRRARVHPVLVIEVDDLDAEAAKASLAAAPHIVRRTLHAHEASIGLAQDAELGREHDLASAAGDGLADKLLVVPLPVDISGVQEADAELDGAMEGGDGTSGPGE